MSDIEAFLTSEEEQAIIESIRIAELNTSGEIRVHIERHTDQPVLNRTKELFHDLKMDNTRLSNAVLFYLAIDDKTFAIYGDKGIHERVGDDFWNSTKSLMEQHFRKAEFKTGLIKGIEMAGEKLKRYFPYQQDDVDELPNDISVGP